MKETLARLLRWRGGLLIDLSFILVAAAIAAAIVLFVVPAATGAAPPPADRWPAAFVGDWDVNWGIHSWRMSLGHDGALKTTEPHQFCYGTWEVSGGWCDEVNSDDPCLVLRTVARARTREGVDGWVWQAHLLVVKVGPKKIRCARDGDFVMRRVRDHPRLRGVLRSGLQDGNFSFVWTSSVRRVGWEWEYVWTVEYAGTERALLSWGLLDDVVGGGPGALLPLRKKHKTTVRLRCYSPPRLVRHTYSLTFPGQTNLTSLAVKIKGGAVWHEVGGGASNSWFPKEKP